MMQKKDLGNGSKPLSAQQLEDISLDLIVGISEVLAALKAIALGVQDVLIPVREEDDDLMSTLKKQTNKTSEEISEMIKLSHSMAMGLAEHFVVLKKVSEGNLSVPPEADYDIEILNSLQNVTKETVKSLARQKDDRIAAEVKLSRENKMTAALISALPGVFYVFNKDLKMLRWNKNLETISGYTAEEIFEMSPLDFFETKDKPVIEKAVREGLVSGSIHVESEFFSKDWTRHPHIFTGTRVEIENDIYVIGVGLDISDRIEMETSLKQSRKDLEMKVKHLERMNTAMVGRELKMVELKKKIRGLEKNAGNDEVVG